MFAQFVVGEKFVFSTLPISRVNSPRRCAESSRQTSLGQQRSGSTPSHFCSPIFSELQRAVVGNSNQILVDPSFICLRSSITRSVTSSSSSSPDRNDEQNRWYPDRYECLLFTGAEPVTNKLSLQDCFTADAVTPPPEAFIKWR